MGNDLPTTWRNLCAGVSGVGPITRFDPSEFRTSLEAEVKDFSAEGRVDAKALKHMDPYVQFGVVAAGEALADSGLAITDANRHRTGVVFGSGGGGMQSLIKWHLVMIEKGPRRISPFFMPNFIADAASGHIAIQFNITGPNYSTTSACASGANAVAGNVESSLGVSGAWMLGAVMQFSVALLMPLTLQKRGFESQDSRESS